MCRLENLDNMETTRIKFQIPAFLLFREKTTHMLVSKNKACGLKLLGFVLFLLRFPAGPSWARNFDSTHLFIHLAIIMRVK